MKWNQQTIHAWGIATFGDVAKNSLGLAIRMAKEAVELSVALHHDEENNIVKESADVGIVVLQVANSIDFIVEEALAEGGSHHQVFEDTNDFLMDADQVSEAVSEFAVDLISSLFHAEFEKAKELIVKIMACLSAAEEIYEFDLNIRIQEKMDINESRKWAKAQDGSFQHV